MEINAREARTRLSFLLDEVERGGEVVILRRGKKVARLVPLFPEARVLPSLREFRADIRVKGKPLSDAVICERQEARY